MKLSVFKLLFLLFICSCKEEYYDENHNTPNLSIDETDTIDPVVIQVPKDSSTSLLNVNSRSNYFSTQFTWNDTISFKNVVTYLVYDYNGNLLDSNRGKMIDLSANKNWYMSNDTFEYNNEIFIKYWDEDSIFIYPLGIYGIGG